MAKVLVADDEADNRYIMTRLVQFLGYDVVTAAHGREVLELVPIIQPDLIILDLSMPVMDGMETVVALRADQNLRHIKLVACTAHVFSEDQERCLAIGFDAYMAKPLLYEDLRRVLTELLPSMTNLNASVAL